MRRAWAVVVGLVAVASVLAVVGMAPSGSRPGPPPPAAPTPAQVAEAYGQLPLAFEANAGQADPRVTFSARAGGYRLFLTPTEAVLALQPSGEATASATVRLVPLGANPHAAFEGLEPLAAKTNYISGSDPARWHLGVPTYAKVAQRRVWEGIDLLYYGNGASLEYDLVVAPGADPAYIAVAVAGAEGLALEGDGSLRITTAAPRWPTRTWPASGARWRPPTSSAGTSASACAWAPTTPPSPWSSIPSSSTPPTWAAAAVIWGKAFAENEAFVTKLTPTGALAYSTYLGGRGLDEGAGIAADGGGNASVTGFTSSDDFPVSNAPPSAVPWTPS